MNTETKKVKQEELVLNYLRQKDGRKITSEKAEKVTKSKSRASMNYLLPKMEKDGLLKRIGSGVYALAGSTTATATKKIPAAVKTKAAKSVVKTHPVNIAEIRTKLIAKKQEHQNSIEAIDKQIDNLDQFEKHASSIVKNAASVLN